MEENAQMRATLAEVTDQSRVSPQPSTVTAKEKTSEPKVASPDFFSGSRQGLTPFLTQVKMVIGLQPSRYPTEKTKVLYVGSFLRGTALLWFQPYVGKTPEDPIINDFELFCSKLKELFGDPDEEGTAERNLYSLKQKGSATTYLADFQRYAVLVGWNDKAKMAQFYRGLKDVIKDELARQDKAETLHDLMEQAVKIDTRVYERSLEKGADITGQQRFTPRTYNPTYRDSTQRNTSYNRYNNTTTRPFVANNKPGLNLPVTPAGKLTKEEYTRRRDNNLCLYCGSADHTIAKCPLSHANPNPRGPTFKPMESKEAGKG